MNTNECNTWVDRRMIMEQRIEYGGTVYDTIGRAARAWARDALPDPSVLDSDRDPREDAAEQVAFWDRESAQAGQNVTPSGVDADVWRESRIMALAVRIESHRRGWDAQP